MEESHRKSDIRLCFIVSDYLREIEDMPIRFISRISMYDKNHLGFFVPKHVTEFYHLNPGRYKGGISLAHGDVTTCPISLVKYKHTLKGRLPPNIGKKNAIAEVWIYRDTWVGHKEK